MKSIEYGNNESIYEYGKILFKEEKCFESNKKESLSYFMKAISNGCVQAMYKYGKILIEGNEMIKNKDESINYIKMAVNKGNQNALFY